MKKTANKHYFKEILDIWLKEKKKSNIKVQTYQRYEDIVNRYIKKSLGNTDIKDLNYDLIMNYIKNGEISKYSISIKKTTFTIIKSALSIAYEKKYIEYINFKNYKFKTKKNEIVTFTKREEKKIDSYITNNIDEKKLVLLITMYTGIRVGEACGLKWSDIDLAHKSIKISRTIQRIKNPDPNGKTKTILISSSPKSLSSIRRIPLAEYLIPYIKKLYKNDDSFILTESPNKMYDIRSYEQFYKRVLAYCKIPYLKFHTLRHTFATNSIAAGVDPKTLSELLGHSSVDITLRLYVHPTFNMKKRSIEKIIKYMKN